MPAIVGHTLIKATFNGRSGTGAISVSGVKVGDKLIWITDDGGGISPFNGAMEVEVTVDDQVQQVTGSDLSTSEFVALFVRTHG